MRSGKGWWLGCFVAFSAVFAISGQFWCLPGCQNSAILPERKTAFLLSFVFAFFARFVVEKFLFQTVYFSAVSFYIFFLHFSIVVLVYRVRIVFVVVSSFCRLFYNLCVLKYLFVWKTINCTLHCALICSWKVSVQNWRSLGTNDVLFWIFWCLLIIFRHSCFALATGWQKGRQNTANRLWVGGYAWSESEGELYLLQFGAVGWQEQNN